MQKKAKYEILKWLPPYGPMYVPITENDEPYYSEGFPVRFFKSDGTDWVANFKPGWTELAEIIELKETENLLVIANGTCYIMDVEETKPINVLGVSFTNLIKTETNQIILQDRTGLTIVEPNGEYWNTERISWDGLKEIKYKDRIVSGLSFDPRYDVDEWIEFSYNLDAKTLNGEVFTNKITENTIQMKVTITSIELKGPFKFFALSLKAMHILKQLQSTDCVDMKKQGIWTKHYTMTLWKNEADMKNFAKSGAHLKAMKESADIAKEIRSITIDATEFPDWNTAKKLLETAQPIRY